MVLVSFLFSSNDISKYSLLVIHSSACSMHKAPMSLNAEFLLGRIQRTLVHRLISWLNLSKLFVVLILFRCWSGKFKQVKASSPIVSNRSAASGYYSDRSLENVWSRSNPVFLSGAKKISFKRFLTHALSLFLTLSNMFFLKWTWHRCHWQPEKFSSMALTKPGWAPLMTRRRRVPVLS